VAVKWVVSPFATEVVSGLTAIEASTLTVKIALLELTPFAEALTIVLPWARVDATPLASMVATTVLDEAQLTKAVTSLEVPSE
jgi:hypothetical protein